MSFRLPPHGPLWTLTGWPERRRAATKILIAFREPSNGYPSYKKRFSSLGNTSVTLSPAISFRARQTRDVTLGDSVRFFTAVNGRRSSSHRMLSGSMSSPRGRDDDRDRTSISSSSTTEMGDNDQLQTWARDESCQSTLLQQILSESCMEGSTGSPLGESVQVMLS